MAIEYAISVAKKNIDEFENGSQLLVVFNEKPESFTAVFEL